MWCVPTAAWNLPRAHSLSISADFEVHEYNIAVLPGGCARDTSEASGSLCMHRRAKIVHGRRTPECPVVAPTGPNSVSPDVSPKLSIDEQGSCCTDAIAHPLFSSTLLHSTCMLQTKTRRSIHGR